MAKGKSKIVKMQSTASDSSYTTKKSGTTTNKLKRRRFDPKTRKHETYEETKVPGSSSNK
jgi:ribosomal protein L33